MPTDRFNLPDSSLARALDPILWSLAKHLHDGGSGTGTGTAPGAPNATVSTTGGQMVGGTTWYYAITLVNALGVESSLSAVTSVDLPDPIANPFPPTLAWDDLGGAMLPGIYSYMLSAYTNHNTYEETLPSAASQVIIPAGTNTNIVTIMFPDLPEGATGWNIYRLDQNAIGWGYLNSVDMSGSTPPDSFVDQGLVMPDCNRVPNASNATVRSCAVTIEYPDANVPVGSTWRIYRSPVNGDWEDSFLHHVIEETSEGSGIIATSFIDQGLSTTDISPPGVGTAAVPNPDKVHIANHTTGQLPASRISGSVGGIQYIEPTAGVTTLTGPGFYATTASTIVLPEEGGIALLSPVNASFKESDGATDVEVAWTGLDPADVEQSEVMFAALWLDEGSWAGTVITPADERKVHQEIDLTGTTAGAIPLDLSSLPSSTSTVTILCPDGGDSAIEVTGLPTHEGLFILTALSGSGQTVSVEVNGIEYDANENGVVSLLLHSVSTDVDASGWNVWVPGSGSGGSGSGLITYAIDKARTSASLGADHPELRHSVPWDNAALYRLSFSAQLDFEAEAEWQVRAYRADMAYNHPDVVLHTFTTDSSTSRTVEDIPFYELRRGDYVTVVLNDISAGSALDIEVSYAVVAKDVSPTLPDWTEPGVPDTMDAPLVEAGENVVYVWFSSPDPNGAAIESYIATPYINGVAQTPQEFPVTDPWMSTLTLTDLTNLTDYTVTIKAVNAVGEGLESPHSVVVRPHMVGDTDVYGTAPARGGGTLLSSDSFNRSDGTIIGTATDGAGSEDPLTWQEVAFAGEPSTIMIEDNQIVNDASSESMASIGPIDVDEVEVSLKISRTGDEDGPTLTLLQIDGLDLRVIQYGFSFSDNRPFISVLEAIGGSPTFEMTRQGTGVPGVDGDTIVLQVADGVIYGCIDDTVSGVGQVVDLPLPDGWTGPWEVIVGLDDGDTGDDLEVRDIS